MKILLYLAGLFILTPSFLNSQSMPSTIFWEKCGSTPQKQPYHLTVNSKGEMLIHKEGAISNAILLRSVDSGKTWVNISDGLPEVYNYKETAIIKGKYMIANLTAVDSTFFCIQTQASKEKGWLIKTQDHGKTWKRLAVPDSKIRELMTPKLEGCYFEYSRPKKFNYLFPPEEELLWNNSAEENWYQRKLFLEKYPDYDVNTTRLQVFEYHFRDFTGPPEKTFSIVNNPKKIGYHPNSKDPSGALIKSSDGHKSWEVVSTGNIRVTLLDFVDCQGRLYAHLANHTGLYRSSNDGQSWEKLAGISQEDQDNSQYPTIYVTPGADGRAYTIRGTSIYRSKELICCKGEVKPEELTFGTTVITHGFQLLGDEPFEKGDWVLEMAEEILEKAQKGQIVIYDKETGLFKQIQKKGDFENGELIILFNWAAESNNVIPGYQEAAADALVASLILNKGLNLRDIHFIGHSRGTVVNSLAVERLLVLKRDYPNNFDHLSIDQVTNISPHDWGIGIAWDDFWPFDNTIISKENYSLALSDLNDAHPDITVEHPKWTFPNNGTIAWEGIFSDTYYQENGKVAPKAPHEEGSILIDIAVAVADKYPKPKQLDEITDAIGELVNYINDNYNFYVTNLNDRQVYGTNNYEWEKNSKGEATTHAYESGLHFIYNSTINEIDEYRSGGYYLSRLSNGKNKRLSKYYGSEKTRFNYFDNLVKEEKGVDRIQGIVNGSFDRGYGSFEIPGWSFHGGGEYFKQGNLMEMLNLGGTASGIQEGKAGLTYIYNQKGNTILRHNRFYVPEDAEGISFIYSTENLTSGNFIVRTIDEMSKKEFIVHKEKGFRGTEEPKSIYIPMKGINYNYKNKVITFEIEFGKASSAFEHLPPKLLIDDVKFKLDKSKLKKADLKVVIRNSQNGEVTSLYENKIRISALAAIGNELDKVSQTLETSEFDAYKKEFEEITVNLSAFRGVVVELEFIYLPLGSGKPKLFIDDVQFTN